MSDDHQILQLKRAAAETAVKQIKNGMCIGLGTGTTATFAIAKIGLRLQQGNLKDITAVSTSKRSTALANQYNIPLLDFSTIRKLDIAIDGADEVDPQCNLIKGAGGAMLREREVEQHAEHLIIIVDDSKIVDKLGTHMALPVEVSQTNWEPARIALSDLGCSTILRYAEHGPFISDSENFIIDCRFNNGIDDAAALAKNIEQIDGVLAHGLFLKMATEIIVASSNGVRSIKP
ncbi:MAG: ribose 5-phosphate isomerase A [Deltaproteobacteria bacterium]|nr:ribose 5-phosphate isomerase A [Deltaproteobacteria bacterium]